MRALISLGIILIACSNLASGASLTLTPNQVSTEIEEAPDNANDYDLVTDGYPHPIYAPYENYRYTNVPSQYHSEYDIPSYNYEATDASYWTAMDTASEPKSESATLEEWESRYKKQLSLTNMDIAKRLPTPDFKSPLNPHPRHAPCCTMPLVGWACGNLCTMAKVDDFAQNAGPNNDQNDQNLVNDDFDVPQLPLPAVVHPPPLIVFNQDEVPILKWIRRAQRHYRKIHRPSQTESILNAYWIRFKIWNDALKQFERRLKIRSTSKVTKIKKSIQRRTSSLLKLNHFSFHHHDDQEENAHSESVVSDPAVVAAQRASLFSPNTTKQLEYLEVLKKDELNEEEIRREKLVWDFVNALGSGLFEVGYLMMSGGKSMLAENTMALYTKSDILVMHQQAWDLAQQVHELPRSYWNILDRHFYAHALFNKLIERDSLPPFNVMKNYINRLKWEGETVWNEEYFNVNLNEINARYLDLLRLVNPESDQFSASEKNMNPSEQLPEYSLALKQFIDDASKSFVHRKKKKPAHEIILHEKLVLLFVNAFIDAQYSVEVTDSLGEKADLGMVQHRDQAADLLRNTIAKMEKMPCRYWRWMHHSSYQELLSPLISANTKLRCSLLW